MISELRPKEEIDYKGRLRIYIKEDSATRNKKII